MAPLRTTNYLTIASDCFLELNSNYKVTNKQLSHNLSLSVTFFRYFGVDSQESLFRYCFVTLILFWSLVPCGTFCPSQVWVPLTRKV